MKQVIVIMKILIGILILLLGFTAAATAAVPSCVGDFPTLPNTYNHGNNAAGRTLLRKQLLLDYDKFNIPDDVTVKFGIRVHTLYIDDVKSILNLMVNLRFNWIDSRLKWDSKTTGINTLRLGHDEIWKPDISLFNSAKINKNMMDCWDLNQILSSNGLVLWVPPCHIQSYCNFTTDKYPYGVQNCELKFGSWSYDADNLELDFIDGAKVADLNKFGDEEWKIIEFCGSRHEKIYPGCPVSRYVLLKYSLKLQRNELSNCKARKCCM